MERAAIDVLKPKGRVALLTGDMETRSFAGGRKAVGVIQGDAVPQRFIPKLIDLYRAGRFPFDRLVKFYPFADDQPGHRRRPERGHDKTGRADRGSMREPSLFCTAIARARNSMAVR